MCPSLPTAPPPTKQASQGDDGRLEDEDVGPGLDDYEPVPDDNPEAAPAHSQGFTEDAMTEQNDEEDEGEDLFGDNYIRCACVCVAVRVWPT